MTDKPAGALNGIRVLDLTRVLAGPLCTMMLGDMGADVIKVEPPQGDETRAWGPPYLGSESAYYLGVNRNKRSITLNVATGEGKDILRRLARRSDVMIDNFKTGTLARWGFDDAWFAREAPPLVRCSITGYGTTGPLANRPGYDFILQAESGLMSICGEPDGEPMKYGVAIVDLATGMNACIAILAALRVRDATGRGQRVEVSLMESGLALLANVASNYLISGKPAGRFGNGHPNIVPYRTFRAADGALAVAVGNDAQFVKFAAVLGHPEWSSDARFARNRDRVVNRTEIEAAIEAVTQWRAVDDWIEKLSKEGIPCGRVNDVAQALSDPQALARDMVLSVEHPAVGPFKMLGFPITMTQTPFALRKAPPTLGEDTDTVLRDELAMPPEAIEKLRAAGVV